MAVAGGGLSARDEPQKPLAGDGDKSPARSVKGQVLTSAEMPAASFKFDKEFKYVGGQTFIAKGLLERAVKGMEIAR